MENTKVLNLKKFLKVFSWISPLFVLLLNTKDAVSDGYNEKYLTDTGHRVVKVTDAIIISASWLTSIFMMFPEFIQIQENVSDGTNTGFIVLLFPYTSNVPLAIILYINSFILFLYNKNRKHLIRLINRVSGDW